MIKPGAEFELADPPTDGIASCKFGPWSDSLLLSASWDTHAYLHDAIENKLKAKWATDSPLLDCCFAGDPSVAFAASLSGKVMQLELGTGQSKVLGSHEDAVKSVASCKSTGLLLSGAWDQTMAAWDHRISSARVASVSLPGKVYSMDVSQNTLVVSMADRHIWIFDTRRLPEPIQKRESSLKYQTRCVRAFPSGEGYVCTSVEGRVAVDFVDHSEEAQSRKYAFKCHRSPVSEQEDVERVYPVNAAAFHPTYATGGVPRVLMQSVGTAHLRPAVRMGR